MSSHRLLAYIYHNGIRDITGSMEDILPRRDFRVAR